MPSEDSWKVFLVRLTTDIVQSPLLWAAWRLLPSAIRLAVYRKLQRRYTNTGKGRVVKLPFAIALKIASEDFPRTEADNTRFVARHTSIPIPRILDVVESAEKTSEGTPKRAYIVMTWLPGQTLRQWIGKHTVEDPATSVVLDELEAYMASGEYEQIGEIVGRLDKLPLSTLDMSDSAPLVDDLRRALAELRAIPPPASGVVGGLHNRPLSSIRCSVFARHLGPFHSQLAFKNAILAQASPLFEETRLPGIRRLAEPVLAKQHCVCFTHADLHEGNILVHEGRLSGIIDWEHAGWYPEYWESTMIEYHMMNQPLPQLFWDAVQPFGEDAYREELALEWALWGSTGDKAVHQDTEEANDITCPRLVHVEDSKRSRVNVLRGRAGGRTQSASES